MKTPTPHPGRRLAVRRAANFQAVLKYKLPKDEVVLVKGMVSSIHQYGASFSGKAKLPMTMRYIYLDLIINSSTFVCSGRVIWVRDCECGIQFDRRSNIWGQISEVALKELGAILPDRREILRRIAAKEIQTERRQSGRRTLDHIWKGDLSNGIDLESKKVKGFLRNKSITYTTEVIKQRREWLSTFSRTNLEHISVYSEDPEDFRGKIESPIGVVHVPLGIAGPLKVNGQYAKGTFFVPMATTEGALITSYSLGSHLITRSGGANIRLLKDELRTDPTFVFENLQKAESFVNWLHANLKKIQKIAEGTSRHLKLLKITPVINGRRVIVNFHFQTGDAMGMNMTAKATDTVCKWARECTKPEEYWLHSNLNAIKKITATNFLHGYGKSVIADVTIPRKVMEIMNTTPEAMERYFFRTLLASAQGGGIGISAHIANALAAIGIACGQDVALVANMHAGVITCEVTKSGDLYFSVYLPCLFAATVGGGTSFGTARECLEMLDCYGPTKSNRFAEIMAATVMAGEISLITSIVNGTYIDAHETFGRNRPKADVESSTSAPILESK